MDPDDDDEDVRGIIEILFTDDGRMIVAKGGVERADIQSAITVLQSHLDLGEPIH